MEVEQKYTRILLPDSTEIVLNWTRPGPNANWVCQATDEMLTDMNISLEKLTTPDEKDV